MTALWEGGLAGPHGGWLLKQGCHWQWVTSALALSQEVWEGFVAKVPTKRQQGSVPVLCSSPRGKAWLCPSADVLTEGFTGLLKVKILDVIRYI